MIRKIFILLLIFCSLRGIGQEGGTVVATITGKVINEATNEAVSYTNIGLEGTLYGTASDVDGNFELKIPSELVSKNIYFSAVGYRNQTFPVTNLFENNYSIIKLEPQSYGIESIDITTRSRVLMRILTMASENTRYNFIGGPFNLVCSYKQNTLTSDTSLSEQNADVVIYDKSGYSIPSISDAYKNLKYTVNNVENKEPGYRFSTGITNIDEILGFDWVRSGASVLNPDLLLDFELSLLSEPEINGNPCWEISFKQDNPTLECSGDYYATYFEGKIVIGKDDYSVKSIEGKVNSKQNSLQGRSIAVSPESINTLKNVSYEFKVSYSNLKPDTILLKKDFVQNGEKISEETTLKVDRVQTTNVQPLTSRDYFILD